MDWRKRPKPHPRPRIVLRGASLTPSGASLILDPARTAATNEYKGGWNHWTFVKDRAAGTMAMYLNGELWASGTGKTLAYTPVTSFSLGSAANGSMARSDAWRPGNGEKLIGRREREGSASGLGIGRPSPAGETAKRDGPKRAKA